MLLVQIASREQSPVLEQQHACDCDMSSDMLFPDEHLCSEVDYQFQVPECCSSCSFKLVHLQAHEM